MNWIDLKFVDESSYLRVECEGVFQVAATIDVLNRIRVKALKTNHLRILVDWRKVSPPKSDFDRYQVGQKVAEILSPPLRIAVLYHEELINKFAENTAVNRGAIILVCSQEDEALEFLYERSLEFQTHPEPVRVIENSATQLPSSPR